MDFDQLLFRFFGTADLEALSPDALVAGTTRLRLQFALEKDEEQRFGLWCLMYMLGAAPEVDEAFTSEDDREAAREFADSVDAEMDEAE
ncbi:hypothetical protein [Sphingomonas profundi]|uniref:hypothetical protein n=1 Tax=Alterirhizorhabdus profundi TaxID=2681549 RepID=UPI0012E76F21|nr:hypothetical protein [Sphingomonas profundi]